MARRLVFDQRTFDDLMWQGAKAAVILVLLGWFVRLVRK